MKLPEWKSEPRCWETNVQWGGERGTPYSYLPTIPRSEARQCDKVMSMLWEQKWQNFHGGDALQI